MSGSVLGTLWVVALFATPVVARASEDGAESTASTEATASTDAADSPDDVPTKALTATDGADDAAAGDAAVGTVQGEVEGAASTIRRGFFVQGDVGLFTTLGGRSNVAPYESRPLSNVEPQVALVVGYDVAHSPKYAFSVGVRFAMAFNSGAGRITAAEAAAATTDDPGTAVTKSADYSVMEAGLQLGLSWMVAERFALLFKADGGAGIVDPNPMLVATAPGAGGASFAPLFGLAAGAEYFTLLTDFSVGVEIRFLGVLVPEAGGGSAFIPGLALTAPVKYTF
ncbi:MAG: adventurous gliding motility protein CglE [Deltaproteobacteria bacterium]|nr:adventurous gliding motility protein CglE [Deltaproteobacteria bacterium]